VAAGASASAEAERQRLLAAAYEQAALEATRKARSYGVAGRTEAQTAQALAPLAALGYHQLNDRAWPGSKRANVDLLLVGPSGVFVLDTKCWADPRVEDGRLLNGEAPADDEVDKLLRLTELVEQSVAEVGLPPLEVVPVLVFAGRKGISEQLGRVQLLGEKDLLAHCARRGNRLTDAQVERLLGRLMADFPPYGTEPAADLPDVEVSVPVMREPVVPVTETAVQNALDGMDDPTELQRAVLEAALAEPIEGWMTFLHPDQARLVRRSVNGPARIRGAAGTGKTVLGLHRAAYLAATRPGQILYVTFVRTLPVVLGQLYSRMAPETADRVEFTSLHRWALDLLRERGHDVRLDLKAGAQAYRIAWSQVGRPGPLARLDMPWDYWREEIDHVIKGRGLTSYEQYADLVRVGRRTRLGPEQRRAVWDLYCEYEQQLDGLGGRDFNDVLLLALAEVRRRRPEPGYVAVVVDEVQDLNRVGVQLLHALVGDAPDGLLLIGDGQQAVYPGGFTLIEAGVAVTGRASVLRVNYRNTAEILEYATELVARDRFDDLEGPEELGARECEVVRSGPRPIRVDAPNVVSHDAALVQMIRDTSRLLGVSLGDLAVLAAHRRTVRTYAGVLRAAGIPTVELQDYDGRTSDAVKVGTFKRAKGLEFKYVFLPGLTEGPSTRWEDEGESAHRERVERERRELFVGMTRARDGLWLGFVNGRGGL
jgi:hypothetical protein